MDPKHQGNDSADSSSEQARETIGELRAQIAKYPLLLYMKGSPQQPQCGFSARAVSALAACGKAFAWVDILAEPEVRRHLPTVSEWPTFPQLFINGELVGGSDIIEEMHEAGELQELVASADMEALSSDS